MVQHSLLAKEITKLKRQLLAIGNQVAENLTDAVSAVEKKDAAFARSISERDRKIDQMEVDLEEECLKVLALYQPVAIDLRFIVTVLKVNNDLERIGDLAANIADQAEMLASLQNVNIVFDFAQMAQKSQAMFTSSLNALINTNVGSAHKVIIADDEIDELHKQMYTQVEAAIARDLAGTKIYIMQIGLSRSLERVADLATNIAQDIIYLSTGEIVRH